MFAIAVPWYHSGARSRHTTGIVAPVGRLRAAQPVRGRCGPLGQGGHMTEQATRPLLNSALAGMGTTIFAEMSALAL